MAGAPGSTVSSRMASGPAEHMRQFMGPFGPDNAMRQALTTIWQYLPDGARTPDRLEQEARRLLERALQSLRDDQAAFGP